MKLVMLAFVGIAGLSWLIALDTPEPWLEPSTSARVYVSLLALGVVVIALLGLLIGYVGHRVGRRHRRRVWYAFAGPLLVACVFSAFLAVTSTTAGLPDASDFRISLAIILFFSLAWALLITWIVASLAFLSLRASDESISVAVRRYQWSRMTWPERLAPVPAVLLAAAFTAWAVVSPEATVPFQIDGIMEEWEGVPGRDDDAGDVELTVSKPSFSFTHRFAGTYEVALNVTDSLGASAETRATYRIPNSPPVARFVHLATGLTVTFDGLSSQDSDGRVSAYFWSFGDGTAGSGAQANHTYAASGSYNVTLTIEDSEGASAWTAGTVSVTGPNAPPSAVVDLAIRDYAASVSAAGSRDPDGSIASFLWQFGDGGSSSEPQASHEYTQAGDFNITLTLMDEDGASTEAIRPVRVPNGAPVLDVSIETVGLTALGDAGNSTDDGQIAEFQWSFGDGSLGFGPEVRHQYSSPGTYALVLTAVDELGYEATATRTVSVVAPPLDQTPFPPVARFTHSASDLLVWFDAGASFDPDGAISDYHWAFGDGSTASGMIVSHVYLNPGVYTARLDVIDNHWQASSAVAQLDLTGVGSSPQPPSPAVRVAVSGNVARFYASGSTSSTGVIAFVRWTLFDPDPSLDFRAAKVVTQGSFLHLYAAVDRDLFALSDGSTVVAFSLRIPSTSSSGGEVGSFMLRVTGRSGSDPYGELLRFVGIGADLSPGAWVRVVGVAAARSANAVEARISYQDILVEPGTPIAVSTAIEHDGWTADTGREDLLA